MTARMMRNMQVPAYEQVDEGVQPREYSGVAVDVKKVITIWLTSGESEPPPDIMPPDMVEWSILAWTMIGCNFCNIDYIV